MKQLRRAVTALAVLVAIGACCLAWREHLKARQALDALAAAEARLASVQPEAPTRTGLAAPLSEPGTAAVPSVPAGVPRGRGRGWGGGPDLASDPEMAPLLLKQRQRQVSMRYAALFARLKLSRATTVQLERLLAEKQLSRFEAMGLARRQGLGREDAQAVARQADVETDALIRQILGDSAFSALQEYDRTYPQRTTVDNLSRQLGYSGAGLSLDQQEHLIAILAEHAPMDEPPSGPAGAIGRGSGFARTSTPEEIEVFFASKAASDAEVIEQVAGFLTPIQVEAVRQQQQDETDRLRLAALRVERIRRAQADRSAGAN